MIRAFLEPGFLARELFQMAFSRLRASLLQALTKRTHALTCLLNLLTAEGFTVAICCQVNYSEINTEGIRSLIRSRCRYFKGNSQIKDTFTIQQVSLPLNLIESRLLIASNSKWHEYPTRKRQEGNGAQSFERHHTWVIDDSPFRLE